MAQIRLSTNGSSVTVNDLGGVLFTNPTTNFVLYDTDLISTNSFSLYSIQNSQDLQTLLSAGSIIISDSNGVIFNTIFDAVNNLFGISSSLPLPFAQGNQYLMYEDFDKGVAPAGWTVSTSGTGSSSSFTQAYERNSIGQVLLSATQAVAQNRAGIIFSGTYNYILRLDDSKYTVWFCKIRPNNSPTTAFNQVGMSNTASPTTLLNGFGNTIALRYDPENRGGGNPSLITNWFLFTNRVGAGSNAINTGVAYTSSGWLNCLFVFDNSVPTSPNLRLYINNSLVATINVMTNVPVNITPAAGVALSPMAFVGTGAVIGGTNYGIRMDKFSVYKLWS